MKPKTLKESCEAFIQHLRDSGVAENSIASYRWNCRLLVAFLGEDKEIGKILPVHIANFFRSEPVTMKTTKSGEKIARTAGSISQIRRVVRWAVAWWHEQGWISTIPLPAEDKKLLEKKADGDAEGDAKPGKRGRKGKGGMKADADESASIQEPDACDGDAAAAAMSEPDDGMAAPISEPETTPVALVEPGTGFGPGEGGDEAQDVNADEKWPLS